MVDCLIRLNFYRRKLLRLATFDVIDLRYAYLRLSLKLHAKNIAIFHFSGAQGVPKKMLIKQIQV